MCVRRQGVVPSSWKMWSALAVPSHTPQGMPGPEVNGRVLAG
jgi:hypothetical protein